MALALIKHNKTVALVIVPKALKENWARTASKYNLGNQVCIMSKEEFKKAWRDLPAFEAVVVDEAHYFSNIKSQLSKALIGYRRTKQPRYIWLLTATPYLSTPFNIYALAYHLGQEWNYWDFFMKFFTQIRMGKRLIPKIRAGSEDKLAVLVQKIGSTIKLDDLIDVPEQVHEVEYFNLTKAQEKGIKDIDEVNYIVRWTKTHQVENGVLYGGPYDEERLKIFDCDKTERIKDVVVANKKVAIFCRYNGQIDYLKEQLEKCGRPISMITGAVKNRDEVVQQIEKADEAVVLINASCSEGYELPSVGVIVFASLSFKYSDFVQAQGRFLRINKPKRNVFITLVTDGVDKMVYESIKRKEDFSFKIFDCNENV